MGRLRGLGHKFNNFVCLKLASLSFITLSHSGQDPYSAIVMRFLGSLLVSLGFVVLQEKERFERPKKQSNLLLALKIILSFVFYRYSRQINVHSVKDIGAKMLN